MMLNTPRKSYSQLLVISGVTTSILLIYLIVHVPIRRMCQKIFLVMVWNTIQDNYLYADQDGTEIIHKMEEINTRIESNIDMVEYYTFVSTQIENLGDSHSLFIPPVWATGKKCVYPNGYGHGAFLFPLSDRKGTYVVEVWPESPAETAGLKNGDIVVSVNGQKMIDENGKARCIMPNRTSFLVVDSAGEERNLVINTLSENFSYPMHWKIYPGSNNEYIGYIRVVGFDKMSSSYFRYSIAQISSYPNLNGLIIDMRINVGGEIGYLKEILSFFIEGRQGFFNSRIASLDQSPFIIPHINDLDATATIPLIVLVGPDTQSSGELFAGILQDAGRAFIIGEKTMGNTESLMRYSYFDGSTLYLSLLQYQSDNPDSTWPIDGVVPDKTISFDWATYFSDSDRAIIESIFFFRWSNTK